MKNILLLLIFTVFTGVFYSPCQTLNEQSKFNFDFEQIDSNTQKPLNWIQWGTDDYTLTLDSIEKYNGKYSLRIEPNEIKSENSFGSCAYSIPAIYKGKLIELNAYFKIKNVENGCAGLLLRIDGDNDILEFDNMQKKAISGSINWMLYTIQLSLPEDAKTIYIGALLAGTGTMWVDDFQIKIDGKDLSKAKSKKIKIYKAQQDKEFDNGSKIEIIKLTDKKIEELTIIGKIWGFLKYYHPEIAKGEYNWDYELFRILPKVLNSKTKENTQKILSEWINNLGQIEKTKKYNFKNVKLLPDLKWINETPLLNPTIKNQLEIIKNAQRLSENYYIDIFPYVGNPKFKNENKYLQSKYPDVGYRLLSLYRYWNIIQYYYPNKHLTDRDWNNVLQEFIPKFVNAGNELEYKLAVLELIGQVQDTHANIWQNDSVLNIYNGKYFAPIEVSFIENKAVVMSTYEKGKNTGLQKGDIIISVDGKNIKTLIDEKLLYTPASNYTTQLRNIAGNLLRTNNDTIKIIYQRDSIIAQININCYSPKEAGVYDKYKKKGKSWKLIENNIGYIYPGFIKNDSLSYIMSKLEKTKGLIIDFRCYPSDFIVFSLGKYLMPSSTEFVKFSNGSVLTPGLFTFTKTLKVGEKNKDYYKGKVVILINEKTQSSAEYTTMAFRVAPKATVIGSITAGADGNVSEFYLPGGIRTMISGIGVYYPNGKETQRVGIVPDIEIKPTIKSIKENKDEVLEKAIDIINKQE